MFYLITKSLHIIFVVSYFAGIFYMVRLFIYHTEALENPDENTKQVLHNQYVFMQRRLWDIITVPAFTIMLITGVLLLYQTGWAFLTQGWMHVKLFFVLILVWYHFWCWLIMKGLQRKKVQYTSLKLRMMNEVATLILFVVVFAVVLKTTFLQYWYYSLLFFLLMGGLIMLIVKIVNLPKKN